MIETRKGFLEKFLLFLMLMGGAVLPLFSFTPFLSFASYRLDFLAVILGLISMIASLWLFHHSHADLGKNWSPTLEIREDHRLVMEGVYKSVRHPMYTSIFLLSIGQFFLLANWIAGPAMLVAFGVHFLCRLKTEEQMMLERFGVEYLSYRQRTKRIIPGVW